MTVAYNDIVNLPINVLLTKVCNFKLWLILIISLKCDCRCEQLGINESDFSYRATRASRDFRDSEENLKIFNIPSKRVSDDTDENQKIQSVHQAGSVIKRVARCSIYNCGNDANLTNKALGKTKQNHQKAGGATLKPLIRVPLNRTSAIFREPVHRNSETRRQKRDMVTGDEPQSAPGRELQFGIDGSISRVDEPHTDAVKHPRDGSKRNKNDLLNFKSESREYEQHNTLRKELGSEQTLSMDKSIEHGNDVAESLPNRSNYNTDANKNNENFLDAILSKISKANSTVSQLKHSKHVGDKTKFHPNIPSSRSKIPPSDEIIITIKEEGVKSPLHTIIIPDNENISKVIINPNILQEGLNEDGSFENDESDTRKSSINKFHDKHQEHESQEIDGRQDFSIEKLQKDSKEENVSQFDSSGGRKEIFKTFVNEDKKQDMQLTESVGQNSSNLKDSRLKGTRLSELNSSDTVHESDKTVVKEEPKNGMKLMEVIGQHNINIQESHLGSKGVRLSRLNSSEIVKESDKAFIREDQKHELSDMMERQYPCVKDSQVGIRNGNLSESGFSGTRKESDKTMSDEVLKHGTVQLSPNSNDFRNLQDVTKKLNASTFETSETRTESNKTVIDGDMKHLVEILKTIERKNSKAKELQEENGNETTPGPSEIKESHKTFVDDDQNRGLKLFEVIGQRSVLDRTHYTFLKRPAHSKFSLHGPVTAKRAFPRQAETQRRTRSSQKMKIKRSHLEKTPGKVLRRYKDFKPSIIINDGNDDDDIHDTSSDYIATDYASSTGLSSSRKDVDIAEDVLDDVFGHMIGNKDKRRQLSARKLLTYEDDDDEDAENEKGYENEQRLLSNNLSVSSRFQPVNVRNSLSEKSNGAQNIVFSIKLSNELENRKDVTMKQVIGGMSNDRSTSSVSQISSQTTFDKNKTAEGGEKYKEYQVTEEQKSSGFLPVFSTLVFKGFSETPLARWNSFLQNEWKPNPTNGKSLDELNSSGELLALTAPSNSKLESSSSLTHKTTGYLDSTKSMDMQGFQNEIESLTKIFEKNQSPVPSTLIASYLPIQNLQSQDSYKRTDSKDTTTKNDVKQYTITESDAAEELPLMHNFSSPILLSTTSHGKFFKEDRQRIGGTEFFPVTIRFQSNKGNTHNDSVTARIIPENPNETSSKKTFWKGIEYNSGRSIETTSPSNNYPPLQESAASNVTTSSEVEFETHRVQYFQEIGMMSQYNNINAMTSSPFWKHNDTSTEKETGIAGEIASKFLIENVSKNVSKDATENDLIMVDATESDLSVTDATENDFSTTHVTEINLNVTDATRRDLTMINDTESDSSMTDATESYFSATQVTEMVLIMTHSAEMNVTYGTGSDFTVVNNTDSDSHNAFTTESNSNTTRVTEAGVNETQAPTTNLNVTHSTRSDMSMTTQAEENAEQSNLKTASPNSTVHSDNGTEFMLVLLDVKKTTMEYVDVLPDRAIKIEYPIDGDFEEQVGNFTIEIDRGQVHNVPYYVSYVSEGRVKIKLPIRVEFVESYNLRDGFPKVSELKYGEVTLDYAGEEDDGPLLIVPHVQNPRALGYEDSLASFGPTYKNENASIFARYEYYSDLFKSVFSLKKTEDVSSTPQTYRELLHKAFMKLPLLVCCIVIFIACWSVLSLGLQVRRQVRHEHASKILTYTYSNTDLRN